MEARQGASHDSARERCRSSCPGRRASRARSGRSRGGVRRPARREGEAAVEPPGDARRGDERQGSGKSPRSNRPHGGCREQRRIDPEPHEPRRRETVTRRRRVAAQDVLAEGRCRSAGCALVRHGADANPAGTCGKVNGIERTSDLLYLSKTLRGLRAHQRAAQDFPFPGEAAPVHGTSRPPMREPRRARGCTGSRFERPRPLGGDWCRCSCSCAPMKGLIQDARIYIGSALADRDPLGIGRDLDVLGRPGQTDFTILKPAIQARCSASWRRVRVFDRAGARSGSLVWLAAVVVLCRWPRRAAAPPGPPPSASSRFRRTMAPSGPSSTANPW